MLVKKLGLAAVLLSVGMSSAFAHAPRNKAYVGADVQWDHLSYKNDLRHSGVLKENFPAGSLFVGYRWCSFGAEFGGTYIGQKTYDTALGSLKQKGNNWYVDGLGYYDLSNNFAVKGLVGVGYLTTKFSGNGANDNKHRFGARVGLGGEYYFNNCWSSALMYKFQTGNSAVKYVNAVALSVAYHF